MEDPDITMEEYVQYETEKSLRIGKVYNWETAKYDKIDYLGDIDYLRFFETKFPAIIYDDALSSQHVDEVNWNNETSLSKYCDENVISKRKALNKRLSKKEKFNILNIDIDLYSYDIFSINELKSDKDNGEDKIVFRSGLVYCSGGLSGKVYCSGGLSRKYIVLAVFQIVHCASGLSFLTAVCLIRQRFVSSGLSSSVAMGTIRDTIAEGTEGAQQLGPERARVYSDLSPEDKDRYNDYIRATNILLQGLPKDIYTLINHYTKAKYIWDNVKMLLEGSKLTKEDRESQLYDDFEHFYQNKGETIYDYYVWFSKLINDMRNIKMTMSIMQLNSKFVNNMLPEWGRFVTAVKLNKGAAGYGEAQNRVGNGTGAAGYGGAQNIVGNENPGQARQIKCYNYNGIGHIARNCTHPKHPQNSEYFKDKMLLMQAQENGVALDEEQLMFIAGRQDNAVDEDVDEQPVQDLALTVYNVFQPDDCDAFDSDVDEAPTAQTMFMANLSSAYPVYNEAGPSYDSDILSEVHDNDHYQDAVCEHHEVHKMHDNVQPNYVVNSHADYTSDSNMIPYDQYVKDNAMPVVQSNVSYVPNDAYMMILNDMHEQPAQYASVTTQNNVVDKSLTAELATYKEQVELYERRAKFELTKREQNIDEQLKIVITDRNIKEEKLKRELQSLKLQLTSTINHNKSMVEEVTSLKKDFKQKENKYLEEFLDMKALKEKDLIKMKAEALKDQTPTSRPIKALMVYPPNTPTTLFPRVLPTKRERGFEKTKECYLIEVIPFFKTLEENFEGIQKALTKEVKEMKDIFEELEAEVDQNVVNRKYNEIEWKNLLIANDNLIADCLSKDVFYIATNFELTVSRFTEMHDAYTVVQERCLKLEAGLSKLHDKVQKADHTKLVKRFSNLVVNHLNLQLKYHNLKEQFGNNTSPPARDAPDFDSVFVIEKMKASIQGKDNAIKKLRMQISQLNESYSETDRTLDFRALDFQITQLTDKVTVLQEQNELFRTENAKIKQHYKELYDSIKITLLATGRYAIDVEPIPPRNRNNREVHLDYLKHLKESVETLREIVEEAKVERPLDSSLAFCLPLH
ncbi:retrovirus-related pol polyprotein from transposon TNT 1-94 [Tanacetum coccineum]|uniref:Retrovirus-related pol polyprotein from transposon TNT 1-94 n=1 Tax=Tanacetum coccineum TaxID=301880 RepID=A0ABQ5CGG3_9ASTR